jgi:hypothetical protein
MFFNSALVCESKAVTDWRRCPGSIPTYFQPECYLGDYYIPSTGAHAASVAYLT